jgi:hypothetical protein
VFRSRRLFLVAGPAAVLSMMATLALAAGPFDTLAGAWRGVGRVMLPSGQSEHLTCKAYYTAKDDGAGMGLALQCASAGNKIDLRATLTSSGDTIAGNWEERSFNSTGTVSGKSADNKLELAIDGTLKATMTAPALSPLIWSFYAADRPKIWIDLQRLGHGCGQRDVLKISSVICADGPASAIKPYVSEERP